jgi:hypothetical protein
VGEDGAGGVTGAGTRHVPGYQGVDGQFDFFQVAAEDSGKELEEAGETQQRRLQGHSRETNAGLTLPLFTAVGDP